MATCDIALRQPTAFVLANDITVSDRRRAGDDKCLEYDQAAVFTAISPGKLAGYAAVYNSQSQDLGGFVERIIPGALKRSLTKPDHIRALLEHDPQRLLGRVGSRTLSLREDTKGLVGSGSRYQLCA